MNDKLIVSTMLLSQIIIAQEEINLYDGIPKGSEGWIWNEGVSMKYFFITRVVYNVAEPSNTT